MPKPHRDEWEQSDAQPCGRAPLLDHDRLPLHTDKRWIVDNMGKRVKWACVNWAGAEQQDGVVGGLQFRKASDIAGSVVEMGFNCVRLPWSVASVLKPKVVQGEDLLRANKELIGRPTLEILDAVVHACTTAGLMVVLDNHMSDADWCCNDADENGLWHNDRWSEDDWLHAHLVMAERYAKEPLVVGTELRNELRSAWVGGQRRWPVWSGGAHNVDWSMAAKRAFHELLAKHPTGLLVIVDGLDYSTDFTGLRGREPLASMVQDAPGRLVLAPHSYPWFFPQMKVLQFEVVLRSSLDVSWGFLLQAGPSHGVPLWISEFGTFSDGRRAQGAGWFPWFIRYAWDHDLDFAYWRLDGTESRGRTQQFEAHESYGLLTSKWEVPQQTGPFWRGLHQLQELHSGPGVQCVPGPRPVAPMGSSLAWLVVAASSICTPACVGLLTWSVVRCRRCFIRRRAARNVRPTAETELVSVKAIARGG
mmetsp:Transcript_124087/g.247174  ORF Transcript_124087/g.247174 Transcript_124087/m.247174 type:complete len:476 (+) Transcript_124087:78-1505(+)